MNTSLKCAPRIVRARYALIPGVLGNNCDNQTIHLGIALIGHENLDRNTIATVGFYK